MMWARTTIRIDDELYRAVKEHAARSGRTIGAVIEDAIREAFRRREHAGDVQPTPTFGAQEPRRAWTWAAMPH